MPKVWARDEAMRKLIVHPTAGGFREDLYEGAEWPDDAFTTRRLQDGDILDHEPTRSDARKAAAEAPVPPSGLTRAEMEGMSRDQLLAEAERVGVSVPSGAKKADIISAIAEH